MCCQIAIRVDIRATKRICERIYHKDTAASVRGVAPIEVTSEVAIRIVRRRKTTCIVSLILREIGISDAVLSRLGVFCG